MSDTLDKFRIYYPEFAGVSDTVVDTFLADASLEFIPTKWGVYFQRGVCALAAHLLAIRAKSAAAGAGGGAGTGGASIGALTSLKTGDLSVAYGGSGSISGKGDASMSDAIYATTVYGLEYLRLRGRLFLGPLVI